MQFIMCNLKAVVDDYKMDSNADEDIHFPVGSDKDILWQNVLF